MLYNHLAKHATSEFTMLYLSRLLDIPYSSLRRAVGKLGDKVVHERKGHANCVRIYTQHSDIIPYAAVASIEARDVFLKKYPLFKKVSKVCTKKDIMLLFGSYADGTQQPNSDIDLLIINKNGKRTIDFRSIEVLFDVSVHPLFISTLEMKKMLQDDHENVGKQALKKHILLTNPIAFWEIVYG